MNKELLNSEDICYQCDWCDDLQEDENGVIFCEHSGASEVEVELGCGSFEELEN